MFGCVAWSENEAVDDVAVVFTFTPGGEFSNVSAADGSSRFYTGNWALLRRTAFSDVARFTSTAPAPG